MSENDTIRTQSVGKNFAKADWILLEQKPKTTLFFIPGIHSGGVRGELVRCRINQEGNNWEKIPEDNFNKMNLLEGRRIELSTEMITRLVDGIAKLQTIVDTGVSYGTREYTLSNKSDTVIITNKNKRDAIKQILSLDESDDFLQTILHDYSELANKISLANFQLKREATVKELEQRLLLRANIHGKNGYVKIIGCLGLTTKNQLKN